MIFEELHPFLLETANGQFVDLGELARAYGANEYRNDVRFEHYLHFARPQNEWDAVANKLPQFKSSKYMNHLLEFNGAALFQGQLNLLGIHPAVGDDFPGVAAPLNVLIENLVPKERMKNGDVLFGSLRLDTRNFLMIESQDKWRLVDELDDAFEESFASLPAIIFRVVKLFTA